MIDHRPQTIDHRPRLGTKYAKLFWSLVFGLWSLVYFFNPNALADITSAEKFFLEGKYERTVSEADRLIESGARHRDELYYLKGLSQLKLKKFDQARQSFKSLLSKYPRSSRVFDAHVGIGDSYLLENNPDKAIKIYDDMLSKFPIDRNVGVLYDRLAYSYKKMGNDDKAGEYRERLNAVSPLSFEASADDGQRRRSAPTGIRGPVSNFTAKTAAPQEPGGSNSVQVGGFKNKKNAEKLRKKLKKDGYDSYVELPEVSGDKLYRVKVGRLATQGDAQALCDRLKKDGYSTKLCP